MTPAVAVAPRLERSRWLAVDWQEHEAWAPGSVHSVDAMSMEDYHAGPGVSKSRLDAAHVSVYHMLHRDPPSARHFDFGSAVHDAILLPESFERLYARSALADRKKRNDWKAEREAAEAEGRVLLVSGDYDQAARWGEVARKHPDVGEYLNGSLEHESSYVWEDDETGLLVRCRPDARIGHRVVLDLKHAHAADPQGFRRAIFANRYHVSSVLTSAGIEAVTGEAPGYVFIALDKSCPPAPEAIAVYQVDEELRRIAWEEVRRDMERVADFAYAERRGEPVWTGFPLGIQTISLYRGGANGGAA